MIIPITPGLKRQQFPKELVAANTPFLVTDLLKQIVIQILTKEETGITPIELECLYRSTLQLKEEQEPIPDKPNRAPSGVKVDYQYYFLCSFSFSRNQVIILGIGENIL